MSPSSAPVAMRRPSPALLLLLAAALTAAACAPIASTTVPIVESREALTAYLSGEGFELVEQGLLIDPPFEAVGYGYTVVEGGHLHVFEYDDAGVAVRDAGRADDVVPLGGYRGEVYQRDRLVVVYYGNDPNVRLHLLNAFGPPYE